ncbi:MULTISPECIES: DUF998 domain-containing protein [unclassified Spirillospora]|uniref:DUF998 domain-containing protein n=1 Tax=unclassified Spirillospora TaxID=2642701 RepID=UPI0037200C79
MDSGERDEPGIVPAPVIVLTVVAAIAYATFLVGSVLNPDLDFFNGYVSELSAADQPFHYIYGAGDLVTGVLTILVALSTLRKLTRRPLATAGWTFLGLFGLFAIGDAAFPLDCAPSMDTWCALRERSGHVSLSHELHAVTSSAVVICWLAALLLLSLAARRYRWWPALARWGWRLALVQTVLAACTLTAMYMGQWLGVVQRVQICVLCLGLLVIAWALHADRRDAAHTARAVTAAGEGARL